MPSRQGNMRRAARPFCPRCILDDLHGEILPDMDVCFLRQHVNDVLGHAIAHMEERVLARADIDKGCLHAWQDILHLPFVDIADKMGMRRPLHFYGLQLPVGLDRQPGFLWNHINIDGFHAWLSFLNFCFSAASILHKIEERPAPAEESRTGDARLCVIRLEAEVLDDRLQDLDGLDGSSLRDADIHAQDDLTVACLE